MAIICSFISCIVIFRLQFKTAKPVNGRASLVLKVAASKGYSQKRSTPVSRMCVHGTVSTPPPRCSTLKQSSRTNVLLIKGLIRLLLHDTGRIFDRLKITCLSCTVHTQPLLTIWKLRRLAVQKFKRQIEVKFLAAHCWKFDRRGYLVPRRLKCGKPKTRLHEPSRSIAQWTMGTFSVNAMDAGKGKWEKWEARFSLRLSPDT